MFSVIYAILIDIRLDKFPGGARKSKGGKCPPTPWCVFLPVSVSTTHICTVNIAASQLGRLFPLRMVASRSCILLHQHCPLLHHCCIATTCYSWVNRCAGHSASFLTPFPFTCAGSHFKEANHFLWPFKLTSARGGYRQKTRHYQEGGDHGNREHLINGLIRRMN